MKTNEILDLLNATANDLVPELKLNFYPHHNCPMVVVGHIPLDCSVAFDEIEIERCKNSPKGLARLFLKRCIVSQTDMVILAAQTLKDLRYQLGVL